MAPLLEVRLALRWFGRPDPGSANQTITGSVSRATP